MLWNATFGFHPVGVLFLDRFVLSVRRRLGYNLKHDDVGIHSIRGDPLFSSTTTVQVHTRLMCDV